MKNKDYYPRLKNWERYEPDHVKFVHEDGTEWVNFDKVKLQFDANNPPTPLVEAFTQRALIRALDEKTRFIDIRIRKRSSVYFEVELTDEDHDKTFRSSCWYDPTSALLDAYLELLSNRAREGVTLKQALRELNGYVVGFVMEDVEPPNMGNWIVLPSWFAGSFHNIDELALQADMLISNGEVVWKKETN